MLARMNQPPTDAHTLPALLRAGQVAKLLAISPQHAQRLLRLGELPGVWRERRWYCRRDELLAVLSARTERKQ